MKLIEFVKDCLVALAAAILLRAFVKEWSE